MEMLIIITNDGKKHKVKMTMREFILDLCEFEYFIKNNGDGDVTFYPYDTIVSITNEQV